MTDRPLFRTRRTVRFGDVDPAGMVYYPRLLHFLHVAMEEYFAEEIGLAYPAFLGEHRLGLPTVRLEADFRYPLRFGDAIEIEVGIEKVGRTSIVWRYRVFRPPGAEPLAEARVVTVNIDMDRVEKRRIPDWLRQALTRVDPS